MFPDFQLSTFNSAGGETFTYAYTANAQLIESVTNISKGYTDTRLYNATHNWVDSRTTTVSSVTKAAFSYVPDSAGRITKTTKTGELFDRYGNGTQGLDTHYGYDDKAQVTSELTKLGGTSTVLTGRDDTISYDTIGNRDTVTHKSRQKGVRPWGLGLLQISEPPSRGRPSPKVRLRLFFKHPRLLVS